MQQKKPERIFKKNNNKKWQRKKMRWATGGKMQNK